MLRWTVKATAAVTVASALPGCVAKNKIEGGLFSDSRQEEKPVAALSLYNKVTKEEGVVVYRIGEQYVPDGLTKINYLLRDFHTDTVTDIDVRLVEMLHDLQNELGVVDTIEVLSGYRTPATNAAIRRRNRGAARRSFHMKGMAVDFRLPTVKVRTVRDIAVDMKRGGVGYYSGRNFIHLDSGPVRTWS